MNNPRIRAISLFLLVVAFGVLIFGGYLINVHKPPIPASVQDESGNIIFTSQDIMSGQKYFYSRGGQHIGSIWGHGSYLAPDWSADFLHRMGLFIAARHNGLDVKQSASFEQKDYEALDPVLRAKLSAQITEELKKNRYDQGKDILIFTRYQAEAYSALIITTQNSFTTVTKEWGFNPTSCAAMKRVGSLPAFLPGSPGPPAPTVRTRSTPIQQTGPTTH